MRVVIGLVFKGVICLSPWPLKRLLLTRFFGYQLHPTARIGLSWVFPKMLFMDAGSRITHLCVVIHLDEVVMGACSIIDRGNWITGFPSGTESIHFAHQVGRSSRLALGVHSAITKDHHIDCTNTVEIGTHTTVAGYRSQLLTHSIDLQESRQHSEPIKIGDYCLVGTDVVILGGAQLPSHCVLGAKSLLNKTFEEEWCLYAGVPAAKKSEISRGAKYFRRKTGFVE
jgi:acetyltransferase-like isoleucine patch superfamily enzyme